MNKNLVSDISRHFSWLMALLLLFSLTAPARAAGNGPVTGSFTTSVAPVIDELEVYTNSLLTDVATSLNPQQTYYIKIKVTENDGMSDLTGISLKLGFYGRTDGLSVEEFDQITRWTFTPNFGYIVEWQAPLSNEPTSLDKTMPGMPSTWSLVSYVLPSSQQWTDPTYTQYQFVFAVKIGKVAQESTSADNRWHIMAKVTDKMNYVGYQDYFKNSTIGLPMNWYGEISVPTNYTVNWGLVEPGLAFSAEKAKQHLNGSIKYLANGGYNQAIKSATAWTSADSKAMNLDEVVAAATDKFALRAVNKALLVTETVDSDTKTVLLSKSGQAVVLDDTGFTTGEEGFTVNSNYLYLSLSPTVTSPRVYSGAITYMIQNR